MSRPLRIEFPGAIYHVTSRGDRREPIYRDDEDRVAQIDVIARAMERFDAQVLAYCQMENHFHLVLHTRRANLSRLMRHVNGVYTQAFNRRHGLTGHLFQGRFKAIVGLAATPPWLDTDGLHGYLLGRPVGGARDRKRAVQRYRALLAEAQSEPLWERSLRRQVFLGDEDFVARMQALAAPARRAAVEVPRAQRKSGGTLQDCLKRCAGRAQALRMAYRDCGISMTALARELDVSVSHVSRLIAGAERDGKGEG